MNCVITTTVLRGTNLTRIECELRKCHNEYARLQRQLVTLTNQREAVKTAGVVLQANNHMNVVRAQLACVKIVVATLVARHNELAQQTIYDP